MHKHKILYIHQDGSSIGGSTTSLINLFKGLDRQQFEPIVLCPGAWGLRQEAEELGIRVVPTWLPAWTKGKSIPFIIPAILKLARFIRREKICLIVYSGIRNVPFGFLATRLVPIPSVCWLGSGSALKKWYLAAYFAHTPDKYITICHHVRPVLEKAGYDGKRLSVIHHGLDMGEIGQSVDKYESRRRLGIHPSTPLILGMGRFVVAKGFEYLIQAVAIIRKTIPDIKCIIVGEKPKDTTDKASRDYYESLLAIVDRLALKDTIDFVGFKYGPEKNAYLSAMDVFVMPSITENFPVVLLEAMSMRRPVVATNVGGVPELVIDGKTGLIIPSKDPVAISNAVIELLLDAEKLRTMGNDGGEVIRTSFTNDREAGKHEAVYKSLVGQCKYGKNSSQ